IHFPTQDGLVKSVDGVSFSLERGRTLGIVGESGSGKSVTSLGIMGLHQGGNARISGHIRLDGEELVGAQPTRVRELRGDKMALCNDPELLIADEPTTALDVTVQAQILDLIHDLQSEFGSAVIMITHDLGVVAELSDDILVMYAGRVAEYGSAADIFARPGHP